MVPQKHVWVCDLTMQKSQSRGIVCVPPDTAPHTLEGDDIPFKGNNQLPIGNL